MANGPTPQQKKKYYVRREQVKIEPGRPLQHHDHDTGGRKETREGCLHRCGIVRAGAAAIAAIVAAAAARGLARRRRSRRTTAAAAAAAAAAAVAVCDRCAVGRRIAAHRRGDEDGRGNGGTLGVGRDGRLNSADSDLGAGCNRAAIRGDGLGRHEGRRLPGTRSSRTLENE